MTIDPESENLLLSLSSLTIAPTAIRVQYFFLVILVIVYESNFLSVILNYT